MHPKQTMHLGAQSDMRSSQGRGTARQVVLERSHLPCLKHGVLQGAGVGEGHVPRVGLLVHGVQVEGGLQLRLASRKEHDPYSMRDTHGTHSHASA